MGLLAAALRVALQSAELLLRALQLRPQRLVGQPQLCVLRLRLQLLGGPGLQLLFQLPLPQPRALQLLLATLQLQFQAASPLLLGEALGRAGTPEPPRAAGARVGPVPSKKAAPRRPARPGWAHLTPQALALLAQLLLHLLVQTPHFPLVLALPPPQSVLQAVPLSGRLLQAG